MRVRGDRARASASRCEFDGPIPETISTDPTRLRQILMNLVGNAIKFTEQRRRADRRALSSRQRRRTHGLRSQFEVIDTGIGMTTEQVASCSSPFTQADDSTTRKFGGTGWAWRSASGWREMLGGDIAVAQRAGAGSTFTLTRRDRIARRRRDARRRATEAMFSLDPQPKPQRRSTQARPGACCSPRTASTTSG